MRLGIGFDIHQFVDGSPLVLGGITIPYPLGLKGHSDADVLLHALMDALLGAAGLGDIGRLFPDTDLSYKGISSLVLLGKVMKQIQTLGFQVNNVDGIIMAEEPKMAAYIDDMEKQIAKVLLIDPKRVNIKATTMEKLGAIGGGEGIASQVIVSLKEN